MAKQVTGIQPALLRWARESLGYSIEEVAEKLKRDPAEIEAWESGEAAPTYAKLETLAYSIYKRPLAVFFLPTPPKEPDIKKEFRTLPEADIELLAADTRYQLRLARALQESVSELNGGKNPSKRQIFKDVHLEIGRPVAPQAERVREYLGISLVDRQGWKDQGSAVQNWRNAIERVGVFVFKSSFKQREISGFCLPDHEFPVIYLNNSTTHTRQVFSLHHELAHVLLEVNAISKEDPEYIERLPKQAKRVERFCNAVAAELLMPIADFEAQLASIAAITEQSVTSLARRYWVSREVVLRSLLDRGMVTQSYYEQKAAEWKAQAAAAAKAKKAKDGGPNPNIVKASYLGQAYLSLVFSSYHQGRLTLEQAADYLGVKAGRVEAIEHAAMAKESA